MSIILYEKIIWFNPPYSKLFNRNTMKISYSCMQNVKAIVNGHNKSIIKEKHQNDRTCNCMNRESCPLNKSCLSTNIVYEAINRLQIFQRMAPKYTSASLSLHSKRDMATTKKLLIMKNMSMIRNYLKRYGI